MHGEIRWDTSLSAPNRRDPVWTPLGCPAASVLQVEHIWPGFRVFFAVGKIQGLQACGATFPYIVPPPNVFLTRLFSKLRLKRKDF
jgi:hypothetical protein